MAESFDTLSALTIPADDDLLVVRDVSEATNPDRKITRANLLNGVVKENGDHTVGQLTMSSARIGAGAEVNFMSLVTAIVAAPTIAANSMGTVTMTIASAEPGMHAQVSFMEQLPSGLIVSARVSVNNTVELSFHNTTGAQIDTANYTCQAFVLGNLGA